MSFADTDYGLPKIFGNLMGMADPSTADYQRLARVVKARRERELELRQDQLPHGPSTTTMSEIENGQPVSAASYRKLEASMGWERGGVESVLRGGEPAIEPAAARAAQPGHVIDLRMVSDGALIAELVDRLAERHAHRLGREEGGQSHNVGDLIRATLPGRNRQAGDAFEDTRDLG